MIKLVCTRLREFIVSDAETTNKPDADGQCAQQPSVDIGQRAEPILKSRRQQSSSSNSEFDVGCWR